LENTIPIGRLHLLLIDHGRQHKGALEEAIGAFSERARDGDEDF
jgi:hypothetical protein